MCIRDRDYTVLYLSESKLTPRHFYNGLLEQLGCETRFYRGDARNLDVYKRQASSGMGAMGELTSTVFTSIEVISSFSHATTSGSLSSVFSEVTSFWGSVC